MICHWGFRATSTPELGEGKVSVVDSLATLFAHDAHANVSRLDHGHVIGAVSNPQHALAHCPAADSPEKRVRQHL